MPLYWASAQKGFRPFQRPDLGVSAFLSGATLDMNFKTYAYKGATPGNLTATRSGTNATDLTYDQTSRTSYNSFAANTARIVADGRGLLVEESRTQYLGVTDSPANQTTASLATGSYTLWCIGGTSVTVAAGTATITGAGSATPGTPLTFTVTVLGTVTVTVSGAVRYFQIENGAFATSYIPNAGAAGTTSTRSADAIVMSSTNFSSWFSSTAYTFYIECLNRPSVTYLSLSDGTTSNRLDMQSTTSTGIQSRMVASGAQTWVAPDSVPALTSSVMAKMATAVGTTDAMSYRGRTSITTSGSDAAPTQVTLGARVDGVQYLSGFITRIAYFPTTFSSAALQVLTT